MLEELTVRGFALIDSLTVEFSKGFNILTGETGAGKSILIGALGLLFGEKAETDAIREGAEETEVSGVLNIRGHGEAVAWLAERGIETDDGAVVLRRKVKRAGRGSIFIQSSSMTRQDLQDLTSLLVDVHGQHEHQTLFKIEHHRRLLDRYAGTETAALQLHDQFLLLTKKKNELEELSESERDRLRETEFLQFAVAEIEKAQLKPGEEEDLQQELRILSDHEKLFTLLDEIYEQTAESRGGALASLRRARQALEGVGNIDESMREHALRLDNTFYEIEDIAEAVRGYREGVEFSPQRLEEIESRLAFIHGLEKKYGNTVQDVLAYLENSKKKLELMENYDEAKSKLQSEIKEIEKTVIQQATELSERRKKSAEGLQTRIESALRKLGMPDAIFKVGMERKLSEKGKPVCGAYGFDRVEFLISPNSGEPEKPIKQIASGGEISRIMLAIKTVLSETDTVDTMIFDEIDAGIGGEVALQVAEHLAEVSKHKQVLCITHLASIAVRADNHMKVEKNLSDSRRVTRVRPLSRDERTREIARMLSGDTNRDASLKHAEEMLAEFTQQ